MISKRLQTNKYLHNVHIIYIYIYGRVKMLSFRSRQKGSSDSLGGGGILMKMDDKMIYNIGKAGAIGLGRWKRCV